MPSAATAFGCDGIVLIDLGTRRARDCPQLPTETGRIGYRGNRRSVIGDVQDDDVVGVRRRQGDIGRSCRGVRAGEAVSVNGQRRRAIDLRAGLGFRDHPMTGWDFH